MSLLSATRRPPTTSGMTLTLVRKSLRSIGYFLLLGLVASICYVQSPLYSSNQNQYFLHGLARAGFGLLDGDWLAGTADPTPIFTLLVTATYRYLHESAFYLYYVLFFAVYLYGLITITSSTYLGGDSKGNQVVYITLILLMHSAVLARLSAGVLGVNLRGLLTDGVAGFYLLGDMFQPSMAGVFLVLSISLFLRSRAFLATAFAALAGTVHPTYLLAASVLVSSYALVMVREGSNVREAWLVGVIGLVLLLPIVSYIYVAFKPTSLPTWALAQDILSNVRLPHHFLIRRWLVKTAYLQIALVVAGLFLARKTRLYPVMLFSFVAAVGLTIAQAVSHSASLALLLPWRLFVYLVPISSSILAYCLVSYVSRQADGKALRNKALLAQLGWSAILVMFLGGTVYTRRDVEASRSDPSVPMMEFVRKARTTGSVYLIPVDLERFRLYTGAPILVDHKSIPYRDRELVEWYERYRAATNFYRLDQRSICPSLVQLSAKYALTHVVFKAAQTGADCSNLRRLYEDVNYSVYSLVR